MSPHTGVALLSDIVTGQSTRVPIEFKIDSQEQNDVGQASYSLDGTPHSFSIKANKTDDFHIYIELDNFETQTSAKGSEVDLRWRNDHAREWVVSTDESGTMWSSGGPTVDWMHQSLGTIGSRKLKHICMPGSHDAGMSAYYPGTLGANFPNTQTQYLDMYDQLQYGSRYFDVRPVFVNGGFAAGHYSALKDLWVGGNGQSLADMVSQINQ